MEITFGLLLTFLILGCNGQNNIIGPSPANMTIRTGTTHTLECKLQQGGFVAKILWVEVLPGGGDQNIYLGETKGPGAKYENFNLESDGSTHWNLVIQNVEAEDGGTYACEEFISGERESAATRKVEAPPTSFTMTQDGSDVTAITAEEGETIEAVCTSVGSRPDVDIWWYQRQEGGDFEMLIHLRIIDGITQDVVANLNDSARFDTTSTIQYPASKDFNGGQLRCVTNGQEIIDSVDDTALLTIDYIPDLTLTYGSDTVTCSSNANPAVPKPTGYKFIVYNANSTDTYEPTKCENGECTLTLKVETETDVRCNATNTVGTGTKTIVAVPGGGDGPNIGGIVGGIIGAVVGISVMAVVLYFTAIKKKKDANDPSLTIGNQQSSPQTTDQTTGQTYMDLDQRTREGQGVYQDPQSATYEDIGEGSKPAVTESSAAQPYMELDQRTRDGQGVYQEPQSTYEDIGDGSKLGDGKKPFNEDILESDLIYHEYVGGGASGEVHRVTWKSNHFGDIEAAAKKIRLNKSHTDHADEDIHREVKLLKNLKHNNVIRLFGTVISDTHLTIVTEFASKGSLGDFLKNTKQSVGKLSEALFKKWLLQAALALQYAHKQHIVHCDVKSDNFVISKDEVLKLCDLGISRHLNKTTTTSVGKGSSFWLAPEVFAEQIRSFACDVYAYGIVVWELYTCESPGKGFVVPEAYKFKVVTEGYRPQIPSTCPDSIRKLIEICWHAEYKGRPSMDNVVKYIEEHCSNEELSESAV